MNLYDPRGMAYASQDQLGVWTTLQFDATGNLTTRTDGRGWVTSFTVDALNREVGRLCRDGTRVTNSFDAAGRQVAMGDSTGMTTYTLEAAGRQVLVNNWVGAPITYTLDPVGNRTYMKDPDGHYWTYEWDADGGLRTVWNSYNQTTTLTHDALGREVQRTLANGVSVNRTFDAAGRETVLRNVDVAGAALSGYTATYDPAGNRLTVLELDGTQVTYTHDAANQLTREQRGGAHPIDDTLQYDGVGNRVSKVDASGTTTYQVNAANELVLTTPPTGAA
ncbi:MAG: hypothetical protein NT029_22105 [Armatimonadetes bacterium]|nr:hypothetical protein [Armatimonadota bacterium]